MEQAELKKQLLQLLEPVVADHGAELVDLELTGGFSNQLLRLFVYKEPGISVDQCAAISREVGDLLDVEDPLPGRYRLEVTSLGIHRPLRTDRDFARADSRMLKVVLTSGKTVFGRLEGFNSTTLFLDGDAGVQPISRQEVAKATIEVEL